MDIKKANRRFKRNQIIQRDKYYAEAINGLAASGKYEDIDKLVETAFEIAVKAVSYQDKNETSPLNFFSKLLP